MLKKIQVIIALEKLKKAIQKIEPNAREKLLMKLNLTGAKLP